MALWAPKWRQTNRLDGRIEHVMFRAGLPILFRSRKDCRAWIANNYGYLKFRPDLRREPHGWKMPRAVRVEVKLKELKTA